MCDLQREESSSLVEELRVQLAHKDRELQVMKEGAEELNVLRQQNYLLQSKVHKYSHYRTTKPNLICLLHCVIERGSCRLFDLPLAFWYVITSRLMVQVRIRLTTGYSVIMCRTAWLLTQFF